jgi:hypothetical protein
VRLGVHRRATKSPGAATALDDFGRVARNFHGWSFEYFPEWECGVFSAPAKAGLVTVDYKQRAFRTGMTFRGRNDSEQEYAGRGWKRRLEADAIVYLGGVLAK